MRCKFYSILLYIILLCLPIQAWAFDKALNQFKNEVSDAVKEFEKEIKKLKKSNLDIAKSLDSANEEFEDLIKFAEETLNNDNIHATIDAIEFLSSNIDAAIKIIPPETLTNMEEVDFTAFKEEEMTILSDIMTDMNRKKMDDFKEMVTSMVILEKQGFEAELFMQEMQDLEMGLTMLNDDSMQLEFDVAGLSDRSLDDLNKDLDSFDKNFQNLKAQQLIDNVTNLSEGVSKSSPKVDTKVSNVSSKITNKIETPSIGNTTKEVTGSVNVSEVDKVQVKITVEFDSDEKDIVASATEEVSEVVETEQITNTTQEVQQIVETASVADTVSSSTEQIENVVENTQITEQISDAQKRMLDFGIFDADGGITGNMNKIDILSDAGGLLTYDEIQTLETSIQDRIVDLANSAGRFDIITGETQARLMCEQGNIGADNYVTINGTSGNMQGELSQPEGKWRCDKF